MTAGDSFTSSEVAPELSALAFDLDGTLIDSRRDLAGAVNQVRHELGFEPLEIPEIVSMVGRGARVLVRRALPEEVAGEAFDRAFAAFLDRYYDRCLEETRPFEGVEAMLEALAPRFPLGLLTNKPERPTRKILTGLGLGEFFGVVIGGDTLEVRKPDPGTLRVVARRLAVRLPDLLYVGDSATDGETAEAAGIRLALVDWGFGDAEELAPFDAVLRPKTPAELARGLAGLGGRRG